MILGLSITTYTLLHTVLSLLGIVAGLVVAGALASGTPLRRWAAVFVRTPVLANARGFGFPFVKLLPSPVRSRRCCRYGTAPVLLSSTRRHSGRSRSTVWRLPTVRSWLGWPWTARSSGWLMSRPSITTSVRSRWAVGRFGWSSPCRILTRCSRRHWRRGPERARSGEHTSELQSPCNLVWRLLLGKKKPAFRGMLPRGSSPLLLAVRWLVALYLAPLVCLATLRGVSVDCRV